LGGQRNQRGEKKHSKQRKNEKKGRTGPRERRDGTPLGKEKRRPGKRLENSFGDIHCPTFETKKGGKNRNRKGVGRRWGEKKERERNAFPREGAEKKKKRKPVKWVQP